MVKTLQLHLSHSFFIIKGDRSYPNHALNSVISVYFGLSSLQGKNTGNPDGLPSILTWQRPKLTFENRGLDSFCHPN